MREPTHTDITGERDCARRGWWMSWGESSPDNDSLEPEDIAIMIEEAGPEFAALFSVTSPAPKARRRPWWQKRER